MRAERERDNAEKAARAATDYISIPTRKLKIAKWEVANAQKLVNDAKLVSCQSAWLTVKLLLIHQQKSIAAAEEELKSTEISMIQDVRESVRRGSAESSEILAQPMFPDHLIIQV